MYYFLCFLFEGKNKLVSRSALIEDRFNNRKGVNDGANCVFLLHAGLPHSSYSNCANCYEDFKKSSQDIDKVMNTQSREEIAKNRMRLTSSIQTVQLHALQAVPFRGNVRNLEIIYIFSE